MTGRRDAAARRPVPRNIALGETHDCRPLRRGVGDGLAGQPERVVRRGGKPEVRERDPHDYREIIDGQMRRAGEAVARKAGLDCRYAEGFRRTRYGGLEHMAKDQPIEEDV